MVGKELLNFGKIILHRIISVVYFILLSFESMPNLTHDDEFQVRS